MLRLRKSLGCFWVGLLLSVTAQAHELWIEPPRARWAAAQPITAKIKVGQHLKGDEQPYIRAWFQRFDLIDRDAERPRRGMMGDLPAFTMQPQTSGLHIIRYESDFSSLRYRSAQQFRNFVEYEGLLGTLERHQARGLPPKGFRETYMRCAKALVWVETPNGTDRLTGMPVELVAEENPYLWDTSTLPVRLYWQGEPLANTQIRVFRGGDEHAEWTVRTDATGRARIDVSQPGFYLLSAVQLIELQGKESEDKDGAVWESYWASLTFWR
jgi:uncharacterized GH25 family protein